MAITGISNGYNMYMDPYYAGSAADGAAKAIGTGGTMAKDAAGSVQEGAAAGNAERAGDRTTPEGTGNMLPRTPLTVGVPPVPEIALSATGMPLPPGSKAEEALSPEDSADPDAQRKIGRKSSPEECQTCKERKYQDGSDENVSFKAAAHISPEAAGAAVRAHEGEHVSNAYKEAAENGGKVVNASVMIHTAICPECGRTYVSGGTTSTTIRYSKEENPYQKAKEAQEAIKLRGKNIDYAA